MHVPRGCCLTFLDLLVTLTMSVLVVDRPASFEVVESVVSAVDDEFFSTDLVELVNCVSIEVMPVVDCVSVEVTSAVELSDVTPDLLVVEDCDTPSVWVVLPKLCVGEFGLEEDEELEELVDVRDEDEAERVDGVEELPPELPLKTHMNEISRTSAFWK